MQFVKYYKKILCDIGLPNQPLNFLQFDIEEIENIKFNEENWWSIILEQIELGLI